jgi:hypothetical protein
MRALGAAFLLLASLRVGRAQVLGGGLADADCRVVFDGVTATDGSSGVVCTDGDPSCDADGRVDGSCHFAVSLCTGTASPGCDTAPLSAMTVAGLDVSPPDLPAPDGSCGPELDVGVPVAGAIGATVRARDGGSLRDVDYLNLCCISGPSTPLDVARCALRVDLRASGCPVGKLPAAARTAFARARDLAGPFGNESTRPRTLAGALRKLAVVRRAAKRVGRRDQCGDSLGLLVSYTQGVVGSARAAAAAR